MFFDLLIPNIKKYSYNYAINLGISKGDRDPVVPATLRLRFELKMG